jgi:GTP-binding protein
MEKMGIRKAQFLEMKNNGSRVKLEFLIPSRGLFGYRNEFLTDTKGEGIMNSIFDSYMDFKGAIPTRTTGSLVAHETGEAVTYGLFNAQSRGQLLISPGEKVYEGMVVGFGPRQEDVVVNVCKKKHLTNTRASGSDDALKLIPQVKFSLEQYIEFLAEDELLEVTPKSLRVRKAILNNQQRAKVKNKK